MRRVQCGIDGQAVFANEMGDNCLAVADCLIVVDDIGKLPARRR